MQIEIDDMVNIADWFTFHLCAQVGEGRGCGRYLGYFPLRTASDIIEISRFCSYFAHLLRIDLTPFRWIFLTRKFYSQ